MAAALRTDPYGGRRYWKYGDDGRLLAEYDEGGCETKYLHDLAGAPTAKILPHDRRISVPGPDTSSGHRVLRLPIEFELGDQWDRDSRLPDGYEPLPGLPAAILGSLFIADDAFGGRTREVRDAQGLLLREELDDGRKRTYAHNQNGGLRRIIDFEEGSYEFEVEVDNHVAREVDQAQNTTTTEVSHGKRRASRACGSAQPGLSCGSSGQCRRVSVVPQP